MPQPQTPPDERQLVAALTEVLRQQRQALVNTGTEGALPVAPIWQPLIDALDGYTARPASSAVPARLASCALAVLQRQALLRAAGQIDATGTAPDPAQAA